MRITFLETWYWHPTVCTPIYSNSFLAMFMTYFKNFDFNVMASMLHIKIINSFFQVIVLSFFKTPTEILICNLAFNVVLSCMKILETLDTHTAVDSMIQKINKSY